MELHKDVLDKIPVGQLQELYDQTVVSVLNTAVYSVLGDYSRSYGNFRRLENIVRFILKELSLREGEVKIADIGCNTGAFLFVLNRRFIFRDNIFFLGVDISELAINIAEQVRKILDIENVKFEVGAAQHLSAPAGIFDIVYSADMIEHLPNPERFLKEIKRVLKPNGVAIITTPNGSNASNNIEGIFRFFSKSEKIKNAEMPRDKKEHISVKGLKEWVNFFRQEGFKVEEIRRGSFLMGSYKYNIRPVFFSLILILDSLMNWFPFMKNFSENIAFKIRVDK